MGFASPRTRRVTDAMTAVTSQTNLCVTSTSARWELLARLRRSAWTRRSGKFSQFVNGAVNVDERRLGNQTFNIFLADSPAYILPAGYLFSVKLSSYLPSYKFLLVDF